MSNLFVGGFTDYLNDNQLDDDGTLPDLNDVFAPFAEASQDADASQPGWTPRHRPPSSYEIPASSDGGWLGSQGTRLAATVASLDEEEDDPLAGSDASVDSDDDAADEIGDAGVTGDTALEWKIDHSKGDHRLHGMVTMENASKRS